MQSWQSTSTGSGISEPNISLETEEETHATTPTASGISLSVDPPGNDAGVSKVTASMVNVGSAVSTHEFAGLAAYTASRAVSERTGHYLLSYG